MHFQTQIQTCCSLVNLYLVITVVAAIVHFPCFGLSMSMNVAELQRFIVDRRSQVEYIGVAGTKSFFRDTNATYLQFGEYIDFCNSNGLKVAAVENQAETDALVAYFNKTKFDKALWLGVWDPVESGVWRWISTGSEISVDYRNWQYGHPIRSGYNCAYMVPFYSIPTLMGKWFSYPCSANTSVALCQLHVQQ